MLEETGVEYKRVPTKFATDTSTPEFLAINPNGKIPALNDNGLILFESLAINIHLAKNYGGALWPNNRHDQSLTIQWLAWALGELEGPHDASNRSGTPLDKTRLEKSLNALRQVLSTQTFIAAEHFTVADLNTAAVLLRPAYVKVARSDPIIKPWFNRCTKRAALHRATSTQSP